MNGKRKSEAETRELMLQRASEDLISAGPSVGLEVVRMEKVIKAAEVSRASAYRIWPNREEFLAETLVTALSQVTLLPEGMAEIAALSELIGHYRPVLDTEQGRRNLVVEGLRLSVDADVRRMLNSPKWRLFLGISTTCHTLEDETLQEAVAAELARIEQTFVMRRAQIYQQLCALIGYRQRKPWQGVAGFQALSELAGLTMRGILSRGLADPAWLEQRVAMELFEADAADWSQAEIAMVTVLLGHLEPDPDIEWTAERIAKAEQVYDAMIAEMLA
ncbi:hypothetical protein WG936_08455 [Corynebacterium sp. H127]|uniref:hypothetical protein n=1 Tax=Corynebacterium sp. H127 TaxID=3133418 RepID=UPI00309CAE03